MRPGLLATALLAIVLLAFAVSVDLPKVNGGGLKGDESTYYVLAHSLARDFDFQFEHKDLVRVWEEFPGSAGNLPQARQDDRHPRLEPVPVRAVGEAGGPAARDAVVFLEVLHLPAGRCPVRLPLRHEWIPGAARHSDRARSAGDLSVPVRPHREELRRTPDGRCVPGPVCRAGVFRVSVARAVQRVPRVLRDVLLGVQGSRATSGLPPRGAGFSRVRRPTTSRPS